MEIEISYRNGRAYAAYIRLGTEKSFKTKEFTPSLLVDFCENNKPVGIEIVSPEFMSLSKLRETLDKLKVVYTDADLSPFKEIAYDSFSA